MAEEENNEAKSNIGYQTKAVKCVLVWDCFFSTRTGLVSNGSSLC